MTEAAGQGIHHVSEMKTTRQILPDLVEYTLDVFKAFADDDDEDEDEDEWIRILTPKKRADTQGGPALCRHGTRYLRSTSRISESSLFMSFSSIVAMEI